MAERASETKTMQDEISSNATANLSTKATLFAGSLHSLLS